MSNSPFYKKGSGSKMGKGCADTAQGCIRKDGKGFKILNNKKGGVWRSGYATRKEALDQLKAMHAN
tara:strand:- start:154 stop:351 length:198 start_codon:yes stop_codon:yes gene_type:complete